MISSEENELLTRVGPDTPWASCCGATGTPSGALQS